MKARFICLLTALAGHLHAAELKNPRMSEGSEKPEHWTETWTASGAIAVARDTETYHSEPASLVLRSEAGPAKGQVAQMISAKAGDAFEVMGYLRADGGATALLGVMAYDEAWQGLGFSAVGNALAGSGWVKAKGRVVLPEGTARAGIVLMIEGQGRAWLDDVSLDGTDLGADARPEAGPEMPAPAGPEGPRKPTSATDPAEGFYPKYPEAWRAMLDAQLKRAGEGPARLVLLGDSLTQGWSDQPRWEDLKRKGAVNFGLGGDGTPQLLYRIDAGILDGLEPGKVMLCVGVNNVWPGFDAEDTVGGITAIIDRIKAKAPEASILLIGNTHFFDKGDGSTRTRVRTINAALEKMAAEDRRVEFVDFSGKFLAEDDELDLRFYDPDKLHLSRRGYEIWWEAVRDRL